MLQGALIGATIGAIGGTVMYIQAKKRDTKEALGPNPPVRESISVTTPPDQVFERIKANLGGNTIDSASTPEQIILRQDPSFTKAGFAYMLRVSPEGTGSKVDLSMVPLASFIKNVPVIPWNKFKDYVQQTLA